MNFIYTLKRSLLSSPVIYFRWNKSAPMRYYACVTISNETGNSTSWAKLCPKINLDFEICKTNFGIRIEDTHGMQESRIPQDTMYVTFQTKQTTLTFLAQTCPNISLGFEIQKTNVRIRISILQIPGVPVFRLNG